MKLLLVQPSQIKDDGSIMKTKQSSLIPTLTLPYLAGLTPTDIEIRIINDYIEIIDFDIEYDLIGITCMTQQILRAYQIADEFKKRGKKVIMGGSHVSFLPNEALQHCDSVVIGEAEMVWEKALLDFEHNTLQKTYKGSRFHDLKNLPIPRFDLIDRSVYKFPQLPVQASRGCPYKCEFCLVSAQYGATYRTRPVDEIIEEIETLGTKDIVFIDDNIAVNKKFASELFESLQALKIRWVGQVNLNFGLDKKLLEAARKSGCISVYVGMESLEPENLVSIGKVSNKIEMYEDAIKNINAKHIVLQASIIVGLDYDSQDTYRKTVNFLIKNSVPIMALYILTPFPGTKIFKYLENNGRLVHKNWGLYDNTHVVYRPKRMTSEDIINGLWYMYNRFYSLKLLVKRVLTSTPRTLPFTLVFNLLARKSIAQKRHPFTSSDDRRHSRKASSIDAEMVVRRIFFNKDTVRYLGKIINICEDGMLMAIKKKENLVTTQLPNILFKPRLLKIYYRLSNNEQCVVKGKNAWYKEDNGEIKIGIKFRRNQNLINT